MKPPRIPYESIFEKKNIRRLENDGNLRFSCLVSGQHLVGNIEGGTLHLRMTPLPGRPVLMRAETIDSCCSDDLVTVLEVDKRQKRPFKITDRLRIYRKGLMAGSLKELIQKGKTIIFNVYWKILSSMFEGA